MGKYLLNDKDSDDRHQAHLLACYPLRLFSSSPKSVRYLENGAVQHLGQYTMQKLQLYSTVTDQDIA